MSPKYEVNDGLFDELNEYNAYVLGYLYALGSIYRGPHNKRYELIISGTDEELLREIAMFLSPEAIIKPIGGTYQARITNKRLVEKLEELGLGPNKTQNLSYPDFLSEDLEPHFIRGYFDGKGSFMREAGRRITANISGGSESFIEGLRDRLVMYGLTRAEIHQYGANNATNTIRYYVNDTRRLYNMLYHEAGIYSRLQTARYNAGV